MTCAVFRYRSPCWKSKFGFCNCYESFPGGIEGFCRFLADGNDHSEERRRVGEQIAGWGDRGDEAVVKLIEIGFKSTGEFQPATSVTQVVANAQATSELHAKRLYLPEWRRDVIDKVGGTASPDST